jgi:outer membrane protein insertion porin family
MRLVVINCAVVVAAIAQERWPVATVAVEGNREYSAEAVIAAAGLKRGESAGRAEFDAACNRLMATGLFSTCQYAWVPAGQAVGVTFRIAELEPRQTIRVDLPAATEDEFWAWAKTNEPLLRRKLPDSAEAMEFFTRAANRFLAARGGEQVTSRIETDLATRQTVIAFRAANAPKISAVRFSGNTSVPSDVLVKAMTRPAVGYDYTEFEYRRMLDLNVRPLYEEQGRLAVRFVKLDAAREGNSVTVTTAIDEGPVYKLRNAAVEVDGKPVQAGKFPVGATANWKLIERGVDELLTGLRNEGYLAAAAKTSRTLQEPERTADVNVSITRGPQFTFGKLTIQGLSPVVAERVRKLWSIAEGAPLSERAPVDFIDRVFKSGLLGSEIQRVVPRTEVRPGTTVADVVVEFR